MDPGTFSGIGKDMGGIYMFAGKEKGGLHVFLVIFTLKEIEIPPAPSRSVHVPLMHMLALPGYRRDLHTSAMSCTRVYRSTTIRIQTFCTLGQYFLTLPYLFCYCHFISKELYK